MKLKQLAAAAALVLGAASAQAITVTSNANLGTVGTAAESFGGLTLLDRGSFTYAYNFSLDSLSDLSGSLQAVFGNVSFNSVSLLGGSSAALSSANTFSFSDLAAGSYTMLVGLSSNSYVHAWGGTVMAQPVPEPQTVAMLLAGLGLMGAVAARRRRFQ